MPVRVTRASVTSAGGYFFGLTPSRPTNGTTNTSRNTATPTGFHGQAVPEGVAAPQPRRVADARPPPREPVGGPAIREIPDIGRQIVPHEPPREPSEEQVNQTVPHEEELRREPAAQVATRLVQP